MATDMHPNTKSDRTIYKTHHSKVGGRVVRQARLFLLKNEKCVLFALGIMPGSEFFCNFAR